MICVAQDSWLLDIFRKYFEAYRYKEGMIIDVRYNGLIDGGNIRKSFIGLWEVDGTQLESRGAVPDIIVENRPEEEVKGKDAQLEKAISYLMEEIERSPRDYDYPTPIEER